MTMKKSRKNMLKSQNAAKKPCGPVDCTDCLHAHLVQYDAPRDPLLAECQAKPQPYSLRFPYQVEIARCKKTCPLHEHTNAVMVIEHRVKPMFLSTQQPQQKAAV